MKKSEADIMEKWADVIDLIAIELSMAALHTAPKDVAKWWKWAGAAGTAIALSVGAGADALDVIDHAIGAAAVSGKAEKVISEYEVNLDIVTHWNPQPEPPEEILPPPPKEVVFPSGWYPDPSGRYEMRYWDGLAWTEHVSRGGQQYTDPPVD
jgi:hypothetical protein